MPLGVLCLSFVCHFHCFNSSLLTFAEQNFFKDKKELDRNPQDHLQRSFLHLHPASPVHPRCPPCRATAPRWGKWAIRLGLPINVRVCVQLPKKRSSFLVTRVAHYHCQKEFPLKWSQNYFCCLVGQCSLLSDRGSQSKMRDKKQPRSVRAVWLIVHTIIKTHKAHQLTRARGQSARAQGQQQKRIQGCKSWKKSLDCLRLIFLTDLNEGV